MASEPKDAIDSLVETVLEKIRPELARLAKAAYEQGASSQTGRNEDVAGGAPPDLTIGESILKVLAEARNGLNVDKAVEKVKELQISREVRDASVRVTLYRLRDEGLIHRGTDRRWKLVDRS